MEQINEITNKVLQSMKSENQLNVIFPTSQIIEKEDCFEMSIYSGGLTAQALATSQLHLKLAFPTLPKGFFEIFNQRIEANKFSSQRLTDAVSYVIDNCQYPTPTLAQFISFDRMMKLYTYDQVLKMNDLLEGAFERYKGVYIGTNVKPLFADVNDISKYKLTLWSDREK